MLSPQHFVLICCAFAACATPRSPTAATPSTCASASPSGGSPISASSGVAGMPFDKLDAKACPRQAFGCGSCVTDGVWGILWVESDCSRHCDKSCGNEPASAAGPVALSPGVAGPNIIEMKVALPTEVSVPKKVAPGKKGASPEAAASLSIVEKTSAFTYFANHASINCGALGATNSSITCNPPDVAHCSCEPAGPWFKATCACQARPSSTRPPASNNCHVDAAPHSACPSARLSEINDPGCATNCVPGTNGVCAPATCAANTWAQGICMCAP